MWGSSHSWGALNQGSCCFMERGHQGRRESRVRSGKVLNIESESVFKAHEIRGLW